MLQVFTAMRRSRGRGGRVIRARPRVVQTRRQRKIEHSGSQIRPASFPPSVVSSPWNNIVCEMGWTAAASGAVTPYDVTVSKLITGIRDQTSLPNSVSLEIRIFSVRIWNLSGGTIIVQFRDLQLDPAGAYEKTIVSFPARNQWARCGFAWSTSDRSVVFSDVTGGPGSRIICTGKVAAASERAIIHCHCVWRPMAALTAASVDTNVPFTTRGGINRFADPSVDQLTDDLDTVII